MHAKPWCIQPMGPGVIFIFWTGSMLTGMARVSVFSGLADILDK